MNIYVNRVIMSIVLFAILFAGPVFSKDLRAVKIKNFLSQFPDSPLHAHIGEILYCADKFGLDYRLYIAIAGAESGFGRRYIRPTHNLTGINSGITSFRSIYENIFKTHELIATRKWYKKYRETKNIKDLVLVYKGKPPYEHYIRNIRFSLDKISVMSTY